jgi:hypothetical protein
MAFIVRRPLQAIEPFGQILPERPITGGVRSGSRKASIPEAHDAISPSLNPVLPRNGV